MDSNEYQQLSYYKQPITGLAILLVTMSLANAAAPYVAGLGTETAAWLLLAVTTTMTYGTYLVVMSKPVADLGGSVRTKVSRKVQTAVE